MTYSESAANALWLSKQDVLEQITIWLANNTENKITEMMTCSKSTANYSGSYERNNTNGVCYADETGQIIM